MSCKLIAIKESNKLRARKYRTTNSDLINKKRRLNYLNNAEKYRIVCKNWRENNPEYLEVRRQRYNENPEIYINQVKNYYKKNPGKSYARYRLWVQKNPEKMAILRRNREYRLKNIKGSHSVEEWKNLCETSKWICSYCGKMLDKNTVTKDHLIPIVRGGTNFINNITLACRNCNSKKHVKTPDEYMREAV